VRYGALRLCVTVCDVGVLRQCVMVRYGGMFRCVTVRYFDALKCVTLVCYDSALRLRYGALRCVTLMLSPLSI